MKTYAIEGMTCENCVRHVTEAIAEVPGVTGVLVTLSAATAEVEGTAAPAAVAAAVQEAGYSVRA